MKTTRTALLVALCASLLWFNMGANGGCSGGTIEIDGSSAVETTSSTLEMPLVTVVNGLDEGEDPMMGDKCLMNYADTNFKASLILDEAHDTLTRFGIDKFNDEVRAEIDKLLSYVEEMVAFADDEGVWGILVRPKDEMSGFVDYLTDTVASLNSGNNEDTFYAQVLDDSAAIISFSPELNASIAGRVEQGLVDYECAFYRINDASAVNTRPMFYLMAKAKTSLLNEPLETALPDMKDEIQKAMGVFGLDKQDGIFRIYFGILDNEDAFIANVITYFSFYMDTDSYILGTIIDKFMEELAAGNIEFGGGDDDDQQGPTNG